MDESVAREKFTIAHVASSADGETEDARCRTNGVWNVSKSVGGFNWKLIDN